MSAVEHDKDVEEAEDEQFPCPRRLSRCSTTDLSSLR